MRQSSPLRSNTSLGAVTMGECDDDYCTGCEPGCGLYDVPVIGPLEAPEQGPEELTMEFLLRWHYENMLERMYRA